MSFLMQGCNIFSVENPNEDYKYTSFTAAEKKIICGNDWRCNSFYS